MAREPATPPAPEEAAVAGAATAAGGSAQARQRLMFTRRPRVVFSHQLPLSHMLMSRRPSPLPGECL